MWMVVHAQIVPERGVILTNAEYEPVGGAEVFVRRVPQRRLRILLQQHQG